MPETTTHGYPVGDRVPGWTPRPYPTPVRLTGRHVVLEPLTLDHAPALFASLCGPGDDGLWTYRTIDRPRDDAALVAHLVATLRTPRQETWAVMTPDGAAGLTSLLRIEPDHGQVEVGGIVFAQRLQRTPATTEATHVLMRWALDHLGYRRFEWKCDSLNELSRRAAARLGFTYEGTFRNHLVVKGRNRDTAWFSVTDREWPAVRAAHQAWLDPANFDSQGRQRSPLRGRVEGWTSD